MGNDSPIDIGNKYKLFDLQQLKVYLIQIILFVSGTLQEQATEAVRNSFKNMEIWKEKLETKKYEIISSKQNVKAADSGQRPFLVSESPFKKMKNAFYFTLKAFFVLKIFKIFSWL